MSPESVVLLVVAVLVSQLLLWIPLLRMIRRKTASLRRELARELTDNGERIVLGPVPANYRGATSGADYPRAKGNAVVALSDRRLVIRKLVGAGVELSVNDIADIREDKWFLRAYINGRLVTIIKTTSGAEFGFLVDDHAAWMTALRTHVGP